MARRGLTGRAFFVKYPSRIESLCRPHLLTDERSYIVVQGVTLPRIDYENFITDMTVERLFLMKEVSRCRARRDGALPCVLVRRRGRTDGVLAVPDWEGFVIWAAYLKDTEGASE
jgi:hypothetical protein